MNYGFVEPKIEPENHVLGGVGDTGKVVVNYSKDWTHYLPKGEIQRRNIETSSCTEYGTLNAIETLENKKLGYNGDYSERFVAIGAENTPQGNDPHTVAEWIRKNGLVDEIDLPFTDGFSSWHEYMQPSPLTKNLTKQGKRWVRNNNFKHEWVAPKGTSTKERLERIKDALRYSPIGVSVDAWKEKNGVYYKEQGAPDNHWTLLVAWKENPIIYDSYVADGKYLKKLDKQYDFGYAKTYTLTEIYTPWWQYWKELFN